MSRRGEGSVRQRGPRSWQGRYRGPDGRFYSVSASTRREAAERLRTALTLRDQGVRPADDRITVGAWLTQWLDVYVRPSVRPNTAASYEAMVRKHLIPAMGTIPLAKLQPEHIQSMLQRQLDEGRLSPTTVRYGYSVLRIALGRALKVGKVLRNVATLVDPPSKASRELRPLTREQIATLLDAVKGDRYEALYVTALGTGMRQGELLALRWSDVDLERGLLAVRHTLQRGTRELAEPKTQRAKRTLRLPPVVIAALTKHRQEQTVVSLDGYVFTSNAGTPLDTRNVTKAFQATVKRAGLPHQRFHDTRHAYATLLIEAGEDLGVVSRILGHADFSTTADVYAHLTPAMQQRAADRIEEMLAG